jgi:hypothetical protein
MASISPTPNVWIEKNNVIDSHLCFYMFYILSLDILDFASYS